MKRLLPALLSGLFLLTFFSDLAAQTPRTRAYLWTRYETGDKPTQTDYRDVFASFFSKVEDSLYISQLRGVDTLLTDATLTGATNRQIPTAAAVKTYVDNAISGGVGAVTSVFGRTGGITAGAGDYTAGQVTNTPAGDIAATTVQAALNELDSEKLQDTTGSVDADNIATGAVGADELASSGVTLGTYGSDTQIPVITIDADGRITSAANIAAASGSSLADGDKTDIDVSSSGAVWTIDTSAVTTIKIASDAVTGAKIAASTIDSTDIATGGIGNTDLAASIVTTGKIADDAVSLAKQAAGTANRLMGYDASGDPAEISAGTNVTISAGVISATGGSVTSQDSFTLLLHNEKTFTNVSAYDAFPSLAQGNGKILMKYMSGTTHTTGQTIRITKSVDDGKTWTNDAQVAGYGATGGSISHIGQDSFLLFYWRENSGAGIVDTTFWRLSTDAGATWSAESKMPDHAAFATQGYGVFVDGRAITTFGAAGTWYVPIWGSETTGYRVGVAKTTDYGATWVYNFVRAASGTGDSEPELIVKGDSLVIYFRGQNTDLVYRSSSLDGATWSTVLDVTPSGNTPGRPGVIYASDGTIVLSGRTAAGTQQDKYTYIAQSFDGGFTFPTVQRILKSGWYVYGDFVEIERGKLLYVGGVDTTDYTKSIIQQMTLIFPDKTSFSGSEQVSGMSDRFKPNDLGTAGQVLTVNSDENATYWTDKGAIFERSGAATASRTWTLGNYDHIWNLNGTGDFILQDNGTTAFNFTDAGSFFVGNPTGLTSAYRIGIKTGNNNQSTYGLQINDSDNDLLFRVRDDGDVRIGNGAGSTFGFFTPGATTSLGAISLGLSNTVSTAANIGIGNAAIVDGSNALGVGWSVRSRATQSTAIGSQVFVNSTATSGFGLGTNIVNDIAYSGIIGTSYNGASATAKLTQVSDGGVGIGNQSKYPIVKIRGEYSSSSGTWTLSGDTIITTSNHNVVAGDVVSLINGAVSAIDYATVSSVVSSTRFIVSPIPSFSSGSAVYYNAGNYFSVQDGGNLAYRLRVPRGGGLNVGSGSFTAATGVVNAQTGFRINDAAASGNYLRGNGTNFVSSAIQASDISSIAALLNGNNGQITIGSNTAGLNFESDGTRRMTIPEAGIANTPSSTKALVLSSADSLGYTTLQSADYTATVTQSGSDTLQNSAICYGHFQRVGNYVTFTVRIEVALTSSGDANTVYFDPPVASNFTTDKTDVIGVAGLDAQALSSANTPKQRALLFASTADDKIGISFDPVASLAYPENRVYISASGSYIIQ